MLKALDIVGLSWLTCLFNVAWRSGTVPMNWQTRMVVPIFPGESEGLGIASLLFAGEVVLLSVDYDLQHSLGRFAADREAAGMRVSTSESEAVTLCRNCSLRVGTECLAQGKEFKYFIHE